MKKDFQFIGGIKENMKKVFLYHSSSITIALSVVMGAIAGLILFFFAYNTPVPDASSAPVVSQNVSVANSVVDTISRYVSHKHQNATELPMIPAKVFFVPPAQ